VISLFYEQVKIKQSSQSVSSEENHFIDEVELAYQAKKIFEENETQNLVNQAYQILEKEEQRSSEQEKLFTALQQVIVQGSASNKLVKDHFEQIKEKAKAIKRLDFSQKVPLPKHLESGTDILSHSTTAFNMAIDTMRHSMVSRNALNMFLSQFPGLMVIVTDSEGQIRFVSDLGEEQLKISKYEALKNNVKNYIVEHERIWKALGENDKIESLKIHLGDQEGTIDPIPAVLHIPRPKQKYFEVKEYVFVIQITQPMDLRLNSDKNIENLHLIIQGCERLLIDPDTPNLNEWIKGIQNFAWDVRESLQGSVEALVARKPANHALVNFTQLMDQVKSKADINILEGIEFKGDYFGNPDDISSLISSLITQLKSALSELNVIDVRVKGADFMGVFIYFTILQEGLTLPDMLSSLRKELSDALGLCNASIDLINPFTLQLNLPYIQYNS